MGPSGFFFFFQKQKLTSCFLDDYKEISLNQHFIYKFYINYSKWTDWQPLSSLHLRIHWITRAWNICTRYQNHGFVFWTSDDRKAKKSSSVTVDLVLSDPLKSIDPRRGMDRFYWWTWGFSTVFHSICSPAFCFLIQSHNGNAGTSHHEIRVPGCARSISLFKQVHSLICMQVIQRSYSKINEVWCSILLSGCTGGMKRPFSKIKQHVFFRSLKERKLRVWTKSSKVAWYVHWRRYMYLYGSWGQAGKDLKATDSAFKLATSQSNQAPMESIGQTSLIRGSPAIQPKAPKGSSANVQSTHPESCGLMSELPSSKSQTHTLFELYTEYGPVY